MLEWARIFRPFRRAFEAAAEWLQWRIARATGRELQFIRERFLEPASEMMARLHPKRVEYARSVWVYFPIGRLEDVEKILVRRNQWISIDVAIFLPWGEVQWVYDLRMPTGRRWNYDVFLARLTRALREKFKKMGRDPNEITSGVIRASIIDMRFYLTTRYRTR